MGVVVGRASTAPQNIPRYPGRSTAATAMTEARRRFAGFPASEPVVTADSWAGGREDRWVLRAIRGIIYTSSAERWLTGYDDAGRCACWHTCLLSRLWPSYGSSPTVERCCRSGLSPRADAGD